MQQISITNKGQELVCFFVTKGEGFALEDKLMELSKDLPEDKRFRIRTESHFEFNDNYLRMISRGIPKTGVEVIYNSTTGVYSSRATTIHGFEEKVADLKFADFMTGKEGRPIFFL